MAMAVPTVNDLDSLLASLNQLKPPGASKNKIQAITILSVTNIQVCIRRFWAHLTYIEHMVVESSTASIGRNANIPCRSNPP